MFGIGYCWQHLKDKRHLKIAPSLINKPNMDKDERVMRDMAGHVIRESIGKGVFAYDEDHAEGHKCLIGIKLLCIMWVNTSQTMKLAEGMVTTTTLTL